MPVHAAIPAWHGSIDDEIGSRVPCRAIYRPRCHASPACTQDHHPPPLWITLGPDLSLHATTCVSSVRRLRACTHEITRPTYARPWSIDRYTPPRETPSRCAIKRSRHPHPPPRSDFSFFREGPASGIPAPLQKISWEKKERLVFLVEFLWSLFRSNLRSNLKRRDYFYFWFHKFWFSKRMVNDVHLFFFPKGEIYFSELVLWKGTSGNV